MGTSGTFGGSKNGLVPSWVDEPASPPAAAPDNAEPDPADGDGASGPDQNWETPAGVTPAQSYPPIPAVPASSGLGGARGNITRGARRSDKRALRRGAGRYVRASGGGRAAASRMPNSRAVAGGVAGLARNFVNQGPAEALRRFNLEGMAGAPAEDVFVALTDTAGFRQAPSHHRGEGEHAAGAILPLLLAGDAGGVGDPWTDRNRYTGERPHRAQCPPRPFALWGAEHADGPSALHREHAEACRRSGPRC